MVGGIPKDRLFAYVRVSSKSWKNNSFLRAQKNQFRKLGVPVKNIRVEIAPAADKIQAQPQVQPIFDRLIENELKENDFLLVTKMDRCCRNTPEFLKSKEKPEFLKLQDKLYKKRIRFISLDLPYSNDVAMNYLISNNLIAMATLTQIKHLLLLKELDELDNS